VVSFVKISRGGREALVREEWADAIAAALLDGVGCVRVDKGGRASLDRFPLEDGWGLIRTGRRGGLAGRVLKDAYFLRNRVLRELRLHARLYEDGLPLPEPLGAVWRRDGPWFRGAIATRELEATDLLSWLQGDPPGTDETLARCGKLIRQMHEMGVFHADLQVRNILVGVDAVYLVDFDKARLVSRLSALHTARNLLRLRRSFEKNRLPLAHFERVCEGYGIASLPRWLSATYRLKGFLSDVITRRL